MNYKLKIDTKIKKPYTDVTGHQKGLLYYRISPSNWKWYHPYNWFRHLWGWEPVWAVGKSYDMNGTQLGYEALEYYAHQLSNLQTLGDLTAYIDKCEEPYLRNSLKRGAHNHE